MTPISGLTPNFGTWATWKDVISSVTVTPSPDVSIAVLIMMAWKYDLVNRE